MTQNRIGTTEFAVTPPSKVPLVFMASLLVITIVAVALTGILDPDSGLSWPAVLIVAGIEAPIFLGLVLLMRWRRVWLEPGELVVRATFYLKRTPLSAIDCSRLRILDLREHPEAKTVLRTNGVGLPGFSAGHFRDRGKRKVFALVTRPRVLLIPLTDDSRILLSLEHPRELMNRLSGSAD